MSGSKVPLPVVLAHLAPGSCAREAASSGVDSCSALEALQWRRRDTHIRGGGEEATRMECLGRSHHDLNEWAAYNDFVLAEIAWSRSR